MLVHERDGDAEAAVQPLREAAREAPDGVLAAIGTRRHAHHQESGPPLGNEALDRREARAIFRPGDDGERMRQAGLEIPYRRANAAGAKIERQDRARPGVGKA